MTSGGDNYLHELIQELRIENGRLALEATRAIQLMKEVVSLAGVTISDSSPVEAYARRVVVELMQAKDESEVMSGTLDEIWSLMYPDSKDWEYPAQVHRHIAVELGQKDLLIAELTQKLEQAGKVLREITEG